MEASYSGSLLITRTGSEGSRYLTPRLLTGSAARKEVKTAP